MTLIKKMSWKITSIECIFLIALSFFMARSRAEAGYVDLYWDEVTTNIDGSAISDLRGYTIFISSHDFKRDGSVYISTKQAMSDPLVQRIFVPEPATNYRVNSLLAKTTYYFRLTASNYNGVHSGFNVGSSDEETELQLIPEVRKGVLGLSLPKFLAINGKILASYDGDDVSSLHFAWTISPTTNAATLAAYKTSRAPTFGTFGISAAPSASFTTTSPEVNLNSLQLSPGIYTVSVSAMDSSNQLVSQASGDISLVPADLSTTKVYPNPWRSDLHSSQDIVFEQLTMDSTLKIFDLSTKLVRKMDITASTANWDLLSDSGERVASGVYLWVITDKQGHKAQGKIAVIQ